MAGYDPAVKKDGQLLSGGSISLQSESHPVEFRKVELLNLVGCTDKKAKNYKPYYERGGPGVLPLLRESAPWSTGSSGGRT